MRQARTRSIGMDVPPASMAGASVTPKHAAEVPDLGTMGTRPCASDQRLRQRPSPANDLVLGYDAGPGGAWRSRSLTTHGQVGSGVAPACLPKQAGDRGHTARRDAVHLARLRRAGALTPVAVPPVADNARRALSRARDAARQDLQAAQCRRNACGLRQDSRSTGAAHGGLAHRRGRAEVVGPTPASTIPDHACRAWGSSPRTPPARRSAVRAPSPPLAIPRPVARAWQGPGRIAIPPEVRRPRPRRLATPPNASQEIRGKAHVRRGKRSRRLIARG
jgi:hypothetical protein